jgi:hypothetical protein
MKNYVKRIFGSMNTAIISPYYDIEFNEGDPKSFLFNSKVPVYLPTDQSYLVLHNAFTELISARVKTSYSGGPGRGKKQLLCFDGFASWIR